MPTTPLPLANGFYLSDSLPVSAQQCVNWYPRLVEAPALNQEILVGTPGLWQAATTGPLGANRGSHRFEGRPYFVNGSKLYRLNADNTLTDLGTISGSGRVSMADNGLQLMILVPGGTGYIFTESPDTLVTISDVDFDANGDPQAVVFIDGYFCCTTDAKKFIVSALNDGTSWNALDFGSAESSPDGVVVPFVFNNQLFIGGERTIEHRPSGRTVCAALDDVGRLVAGVVGPRRCQSVRRACGDGQTGRIRRPSDRRLIVRTDRP